MKKNTPRRHHYIPQHYLKGFSSPDLELIWVYDKRDKQKAPFQTTPVNIAVEKDYYKLNLYEGDEDTSAVEQHFANKIEGPANAILDKIRMRDKIDAKEKYIMTFYLYSMFKRVPAAKKRAKNIMPGIADSVLKEFNQMIDSNTRFSHYTEEAKQSLREYGKSFIQQQFDNPSVLYMIPSQSSGVLPVMMKMNWYFLYTSDDQFLTCDNPVFTHWAKERTFSR